MMGFYFYVHIVLDYYLVVDTKDNNFNGQLRDCVHAIDGS